MISVMRYECSITTTLHRVTLTSQNGWTPLMRASREGHVDVVQILNYGQKVTCEDSVRRRSNDQNDYNELQEGLDALILAAVNEHPDVVKILIDSDTFLTEQVQVRICFA